MQSSWIFKSCVQQASTFDFRWQRIDSVVSVSPVASMSDLVRQQQQELTVVVEEAARGSQQTIPGVNFGSFLLPDFR